MRSLALAHASAEQAGTDDDDTEMVFESDAALCSETVRLQKMGRWAALTTRHLPQRRAQRLARRWPRVRQSLRLLSLLSSQASKQASICISIVYRERALSKSEAPWPDAPRQGHAKGSPRPALGLVFRVLLQGHPPSRRALQKNKQDNHQNKKNNHQKW